MGREIKFRLWDTFNERMVYDFHRFEPIPDFKKDDPMYNADYRYFESWREEEDGIDKPCIPQQYTGLKDKDGKEIYEDDLCEDISGDLWAVKYMDGCFWFCNPNDESNRNSYDWLKDVGEWENGYEVVGNIYETPELLKQPQ